MPESKPHDRRSESVFGQMDAMVERRQRDAAVYRNLAVRWDEKNPRVGVDPDVCIVAPAPPERDELQSLLLWKEGHHPPLVAVEIVSQSRPGKDYTQSPAKYAANGTRELWVFDPDLAGPTNTGGGPYRLQIFRRDENGDFLCVYAGEGPARSEALDAWVFAVNEGQALRIADDEAGTSWWRTREEEERKAKEEERKAKEEERRAKEEERRAKEEAQVRANRLAEKLREMGVDPETIP